MSFGRFSHTVDAGFQWRAPYPFQSHEIVNLTQLRSVDVGSNLGHASHWAARFLHVDPRRKYRRHPVHRPISPGRCSSHLFENRSSDEAVSQAAESAVREIVGNSTMDSVLYEQRDAIASELVKSIQAQLNRLKAGVTVANVNVQSVQAPEQVQAAFDDAFKAGADRERLKMKGKPTPTTSFRRRKVPRPACVKRLRHIARASWPPLRVMHSALRLFWLNNKKHLR